MTGLAAYLYGMATSQTIPIAVGGAAGFSGIFLFRQFERE
jgi:hypothetical protein